MTILDRYASQVRFLPLGEEGQQQRLEETSVLLCGCGALGSAIAKAIYAKYIGD